MPVRIDYIPWSGRAHQDKFDFHQRRSVTNHSHPFRCRRQLLVALGLLPLSGLAPAATPPAPRSRSAPTEVQVWKGPTCDCCNDWIAPVAAGLAAPGMPIGAPGMDTPAYGGKKNAYNVMLVARDGSATVYRKFEGNQR